MGFGLVVEKCKRDYSPLESVRGVEDDIKKSTCQVNNLLHRIGQTHV